MDKKLQAIMLNLLMNYIEQSMYAAQKQLLSSRNPQPWMVDKAFTNLFQNVPSYYAQSTMQPGQQQGGMQDILASILGNAPQQSTPAIPVGAKAEWDGSQWIVK
tara:strand:+ start:2443 stop:2754 length:312 start_codon:yes stop_codon:yes gene_type:complete